MGKSARNANSVNRLDALTVATVAEAKALQVPIGTKVVTSGYYEAGDGGGNDYIVVAGGTGADDGGSFIDMNNGNQLKGFFGKNINVKNFGAVSDGVQDKDTLVVTGTNNFDFFESALKYIAGNSKMALYVPSGFYAVYSDGSVVNSQLKIRSSIVIYGDSKKTSKILQSTGSFSQSVPILDCRDYSVLPDFVVLRNIGLNSDWGANGDFSKKNHLAAITNVGSRIEVDNCSFKHARNFALSLAYVPFDANPSVIVKGCDFDKAYGDGCSIRASSYALVKGNVFKDINDDCIAVHSRDETPQPLNNRAIITDNFAADSQGIRVQGVKACVISNNIIVRAVYSGIALTTARGVEGNTQNFNYTISNNVIDTVFDAAAFSTLGGQKVRYINIETPVPSDKGNGYVGYGKTGGGVLQPYDYFYVNDNDDSLVNPEFEPYFINIKDNVLTRTYGPVNNYSDYGVGERYSRVGPVNPAITEEDLGLTYNVSLNLTYAQLVIKNSARFSRISNNIFNGGSTAVLLYCSDPSVQAFNDLVIENNSISNFYGYGVAVDGKSDITFNNNKINGDPFYKHSGRLSTGGWNPSGNQCIAIRAINDAYLHGSNNSFRNISKVLNLGAPDLFVGSNTDLYGKPAINTPGIDSSNLGIGEFYYLYNRLGLRNIFITEEDSSDSNFGSIVNVCKGTQDSKPNSGYYPSGFYVDAKPKVVRDKEVVIGWKRITSGSGHVLGTDWEEVYAETALNSQDFGSSVAGEIIAQGVATSTTEARFFLPVSSFSKPVSITTSGKFDIVNSTSSAQYKDAFTSSSMSLSGTSSQRMAIIDVAGAVNMTVGQTVLLRSESSTPNAIIKINF